MRVFLAIRPTANSAIADNRTWYRNLYEPLIDLGHDVVLFDAEKGKDAARKRRTDLRARFSEQMVWQFMKETHDAGIDLFFSYLTDGMVEPGAIDEIRRTGVPTCNFSCNNAHQFYLVEQISSHFDYSLHAERDARDKFLGVGANPLWWPMASNPKYFGPIHCRRTIEASFVGGSYALRSRYVESLLRSGVDAHAYGPNWTNGASTKARTKAKRVKLLAQALTSGTTSSQYRASAQLAELDQRRNLARQYPRNVHVPVSDEKLIKLYSQSHISLGFVEVFDRHDPTAAVIKHLHLREFEAPMCGALYVTGYTNELAEMFDIGKEVVAYRDTEELVDKAKYYLAHPKQAERVRAAGRHRALKCHTYQKRFRDLIGKVAKGQENRLL